MSLSIVIPSKTISNLSPCVSAIIEHDPEHRIIVIDNGLTAPPPSVCEVIDYRRTFIFAEAANIGIRAAGDDDVILLNDDALLETQGGFTRMQTAAQDHPEYGIISATTNHAGNPAQMRQRTLNLRTCPSPTPGNSFATVAFICVLIPRRTIEALGADRPGGCGYLDERYTAYGWEDNDYCRNINRAGMKIGIHDGCYVDHSKLTSTFRGGAAIGGDIAAGRKIYLDKWGGV